MCRGKEEKFLNGYKVSRSYSQDMTGHVFSFQVKRNQCDSEDLSDGMKHVVLSLSSTYLV